MATATRGEVKPTKAPVILELTQHEASVLLGAIGPICCPGEALYQIYAALNRVEGGLDTGPREVFGGKLQSSTNPCFTESYFAFSNKEAHTYDDAV